MDDSGIFCAGRNSDPVTTNVRNVKSPHWRRLLGLEKGKNASTILDTVATCIFEN
jgi:hypothetical protein